MIENLINAITSLGKPSWLDYIQIVASIVSIIISAIALVKAIEVPTKIAHIQNNIALFDKRFAAYNEFQKYEAFSTELKNFEGVEKYKKIFITIFYEDKDVPFQAINAIYKVKQTSMFLHQMVFLFENITGTELKEILSIFLDFIIALEKNERVEELKNMYINAIDAFRKKHVNHICNVLKTEQ